MKTNIIDLTSMYPTRRLITYIVNGKPNQKKYYKRLPFYKDIIKTILKRKSSYIITTPKKVYTHIIKGNGEKIISLEPVIYLKDDE